MEEPSSARDAGSHDDGPEARLAELERERAILCQRLAECEAALGASDQRYQRLADAITDYIYTARVADGRVVETRHGPGCVAVTGYQSEEFSADPYLWYRMVAEDDRSAVEEHVRRILAGDTSAIEHRILRKDGQERWVRNTPVLERDAAGRVVAYDGLVQDVTERRLAEEILRESEQRYRQLFDAGGDAVFVHELAPNGTPGRFLVVNDTACDRLGYRRERLLTMSPADINAPWRDADLAPVFERFRTGQPATFEQVHVARSGRHIPVEIHARPFNFRGVPAVIALVRDITDRKRMQDATEALRNRTTPLVGEAFFRSLIEELTRILGMRHAWIGRISAEPPLRIRTLCACTDGHLVENLTYDLGGMPCEAVFGQTLRFYPTRSRELFPRAPLLRELGIESYLGVPLVTGSGAALGVMCLLDDQPQAPSELANTLLTVYAARVSAEIERLEAEAALRRSEEKFKTLIETTHTGYVIADLEGRVVDANQEYVHLTGHTSLSEIVGRSALEWTPSLVGERLAEVAERLDRGPVRDLEVYYHDGQGTSTPVEINADRVGEGESRQIVGLVRDITERKRVEDAERQREARFRAIVETTQEWIWAIDLAGQHTYSNPALATILGYLPEEILGVAATELIHPEDRSLMEELLAASVAGRQGWSGIILRWRHKDGGYRYLEGNAVPLFDPRGELIGFQGADRDITERQRAEEVLRESEERFRSTFEQAAVGIVHAHPSGRVLRVNQRYCDIVGYSREEVLGLSYQDTTLPEDLEAELIAGRRLLTGEISSHSREKRYRRKDGSPVWVNLTVSLCRSAAGDPEYFIAVLQDASERKRAERALRFTQFAVDNVADAGFWIDRDARFIYVNHEACASLGYTTEELLRMALPEIAPDLRWEEWPQRWQRLSKLGRMGYESRHRTKDGRTFPVEIQANFVEFEGERYICAFARDITARKQAEQALRESEEQFRALVENNPDMVARFDRECRHLYVNPAVQAELGVAPGEVIGRTHWSRGQKPPMVDWFESIIRQVFESGQEQTFELSLITPQGVKHYLSRGVPEFAADGSVASALFIHRNISDRKRAEEALREHEKRLRAVVSNSEALIFQLDANGVFLLCEGRALGPLGLAPGQAVGQSIFELFAEHAPLLEGVRRALGGEVASFTARIAEMTFDTTASPVLDDQGRVSSVVGIATDVTARRRAEEEKDRLHMQLIQAQKMEAIGRLAGGVAHDFNNLLTGILGFSELALLELERECEVAQCLLGINQVVEQCKGLTQQILAFSRQQVLSMTVVDLNAVILSAGKMLRRIIGEDIQIKTVLEPNLGRVRADAAQLQQILLNLAVNARDAMPQGGTLTIATENAALSAADRRENSEIEGGDLVLLTVSDRGSGMDSETLSRVFEPFFTTKQLGRGTGLGLATVYGIVKQHGGLIEVQSAPGAGTVFKIYLPQVAEASSGDDAATGPLSAAPGDETILVVEDDLLVRDLTVKHLAACGYQVLSAPGPLQAINLVRQHNSPISLLVTDVIMPDMDGRELYLQLVKERPELKVLYMSGYPGSRLAEHGGNLAEGPLFVQKPFGIAALTRQIRRILDTK